MKHSKSTQILVYCIVLALVIYLLWQSWPILRTMTSQDHIIMATWTMAVFTIILAIFTLLQQRATQGQLKAFREAQTWDRLRFHSKKLKTVVSQWIALVSQIEPLKLVTIPISRIDSVLSGMEFEALWAHTETGYPGYATHWKEFKREYEAHRKRVEGFFSRLRNEVERRVILPVYHSEGTEPSEWFDSSWCARIAYSILTKNVQANYYQKQNPPRIVAKIPLEIQWPEGTTIAKVSDETKWTLIQQAVTDLTTDPRMVSEASELIRNGQEIAKSVSKFKSGFLDHSRNVIDLGGILCGECEYCNQLKLK